MHGLDRRAGKLELPAGLERDRAAAGHVGEPDDVVALHDRLPAEQVLHAVEQRADAARPAVGHGPVAVHGEDELLVLGADAEFRLRLAARLKPRDQLVARVDRRHIDLVAGHAGVPAKKGRDLNHGHGERAMLTAGGHIRIGGRAGARSRLIERAGDAARKCRQSIRLLEFQHELVDRHLGLKNPLVARVLGMAEEVAAADELEAGRLDLAL